MANKTNHGKIVHSVTVVKATDLDGCHSIWCNHGDEDFMCADCINGTPIDADSDGTQWIAFCGGCTNASVPMSKANARKALSECK